ncbi:DUF6458 family protein [Ornithinimicrobium cavernae]|uniref:DUF6458 family protein n=1 Tax=Ornithinimicrobium cavernae TaxID=2666047 RepID=UPI000D687D4E|nr:DUF6458 family protein [Ornithinimicrobium cavernae]
MGIGLGITLLVIGAILSFTTLDSDYIGTNLNTVGWILMGGGALALILGLIQNAQRTRTAHTVVEERRGGPDVIERRGPDVIERDVTDRRDDPRV